MADTEAGSEHSHANGAILMDSDDEGSSSTAETASPEDRDTFAHLDWERKYGPGTFVEVLMLIYIWAIYIDLT